MEWGESGEWGEWKGFGLVVGCGDRRWGKGVMRDVMISCFLSILIVIG